MGEEGSASSHIVAHAYTKVGAEWVFSFLLQVLLLKCSTMHSLDGIRSHQFLFLLYAPPACILIMFLLHLPKRPYMLSECAVESMRCITAWKIEFQINIWEPVYAFRPSRGPCFCSYEFTFVITFPCEFNELSLLSFDEFFTLSITLPSRRVFVSLQNRHCAVRLIFSERLVIVYFVY